MVERLLEVKDFFMENNSHEKNLNVNGELWSFFMLDFVEAFKRFKATSLKLKSSKMGLRDFYKQRLLL